MWPWEPGASTGVTDQGPPHSGASIPSAAEFDGARRNGARLVPGAGQVATAHSLVAGVPHNDRGYDRYLDGFEGSVLGNHPDGQFMQNTAATSDHSLHSNYESLTAFRGIDETIDMGGSAQEHLNYDKGISRRASSSQLFANRKTRLEGQEGGMAILVAPAKEAFINRDWSTTELTGLALGAYYLTSVVF